MHFTTNREWSHAVGCCFWFLALLTVTWYGGPPCRRLERRRHGSLACCAPIGPGYAVAVAAAGPLAQMGRGALPGCAADLPAGNLGKTPSLGRDCCCVAR